MVTYSSRATSIDNSFLILNWKKKTEVYFTLRIIVGSDLHLIKFWSVPMQEIKLFTITSANKIMNGLEKPFSAISNCKRSIAGHSVLQP